jgi:prephenate dehydrogenase
MRPSSLAVIGLGAIGGSLAWQSRQAGVARVVGYSSSRRDGVQALQAGAITELADSAVQAVGGVELVVLAVPPRPTLELIGELADRIDAGALLTDVCSVKVEIMRRALDAGMGDRFAGGHPLAGTHESGFHSARPDRLRGCVVYICESGSSEGHRAAQAISSFWQHTLGASPIRIDSAAHDRQLAWTSHLPQATATALAKSLLDRGLAGVSFGTGARDTTRLAAGNPAMWSEIFLLNRGPIGEALDQLARDMEELRQLLLRGDAKGLAAYLTAARTFREGLER